MVRTSPVRVRRRPHRAVASAVSATAAATVALAVCPQPAAASAPAPEAVRASDPVGGVIEVTPRHVEPGTELRVRVGFCATERTAMATSVAFEADVDLRRAPDGAGFHGSPLISANAEPGTYGITVVCGLEGQEGRGSFQVVPADGGHGDHGTRLDGGPHAEGGPHIDGGPHPDSGPGRDGHDEPPPRHASPVAPVRAGGGGTAGDRAGDAAVTAQRAGLVMAGGAALAGAAVWAVRRRSGAYTGGKAR